MKIDKSFRNLFDLKEISIKLVILCLLTFASYKILGLPWIYDTYIARLICVYQLYLYLLKKVVINFIKLIGGLVYQIRYILDLKKKRIEGTIESIQYYKNKFIIKVQENGNSYWTNYYYYSYNFKKKLLYNENLIGRKVLFLISNKKAIIDKII